MNTVMGGLTGGPRIAFEEEFMFKQSDSDRLAAAGDKAFKEHQTAKRNLEKGVPEWEQRTRHNAQFAASVTALPHAFTHRSPDVLAKALEAKMLKEFNASVQAVDAFIVPLTEAEETTKQTLFRINSTVIGAFSSWSNRICSALPDGHPLRVDLEAAKRALEAMTMARTSEIVAVIRPLIETAESDESLDIPLFRFEAMTKRAIGEPVAV
jgi:hypothetical protein